MYMTGCDGGGGGGEGGGGGGGATARTRTLQLHAPEELREGCGCGHYLGPTFQDTQYTTRLLANVRGSMRDTIWLNQAIVIVSEVETVLGEVYLCMKDIAPHLVQTQKYIKWVEFGTSCCFLSYCSSYPIDHSDISYCTV